MSKSTIYVIKTGSYLVEPTYMIIYLSVLFQMKEKYCSKVRT